MEYRGVYNSAGAQTHKGTVIKSSKEDDTPQVNLLKVDDSTTRGRAFIKSDTLVDADLNVAKFAWYLRYLIVRVERMYIIKLL